MTGFTRAAVFAAGAFSLMCGQAAVAASAVPAIDPIVSVSLFGTAQSRAAVCAAGATAAAAAAASSATAGSAQGNATCVLPITGAAPPAPAAQGVPAPARAAGGLGALGTLPLLLALAALVALGTAVFGGGDNFTPVSPD